MCEQRLEKSLSFSLSRSDHLSGYAHFHYNSPNETKRTETKRNESSAAYAKRKTPKAEKKNRKIIKRNVICFLITYDENERHNQMGKTMKTQEEGAEEREMLSSLSACCQHSQFIS